MRRALIAVIALALAGVAVSLLLLLGEAVGSASFPILWTDSRGLLWGIPVEVYDVALYFAIALLAAVALASMVGRRRFAAREG